MLLCLIPLKGFHYTFLNLWLLWMAMFYVNFKIKIHGVQKVFGVSKQHSKTLYSVKCGK